MEQAVVDEPADHVARAKIDGHIDVCTERYGNLWTAIGDLKKEMGSISNRIFALLAATCGAAVLGLCGVVFYLLTSKLPPHP